MTTRELEILNLALEHEIERQQGSLAKEVPHPAMEDWLRQTMALKKKLEEDLKRRKIMRKLTGK